MRWWVLLAFAPPAALMVYISNLHVRDVIKNWGRHPQLDPINLASCVWMYMALFAIGAAAMLAAMI